MKHYYFTPDCYWDADRKQLIRNGNPIDLPTRQTNLLAYLMANNGHFVSHEKLYRAMTGGFNTSGNWKADLSNAFTRNRPSEQGLLARVPEIIPPIYDHKKDLGYKIDIPTENIIEISSDETSMLDEYSDIWHSSSYWSTQLRKARMSDRGWLSKKVKQYLQGVACSWPIIFSSAEFAPVRRDVVDEIKEAINNELGVIVLTGAGGEGKTTILMQLCAELYHDGKTVLYHADTPKYDLPEGLVNCILLVDNPSNTHEFRSFLTRAIKEGLSVVIASRSNEWATLKGSLSPDTQRSVKEIEISKITRSEARAFARYVKNNAYWVRRNTKELETLFVKDSYGFLYASMLMAMHNSDSLEEIAKGIITRISSFENGQSALKILAAIVFLEQAGAKTTTRTYRLLCRSLSLDDRAVKFQLRKEVSLNGNLYQTRHSSISKLFYKFLFEKDELDNWLTEEYQEDVIIAVLNLSFDEISKSTRDFKPGDPRIIETSTLFTNAVSIIDFVETQDYLIQRLFEACRQHGLALIERVHHKIANDEIRDIIARDCYDATLPVWGVYNRWISYMSAENDNLELACERIQHICSQMDAPVDMWSLWAEIQEKTLQDTKEASLQSVRDIYIAGSEKFSDNAHWWMHWASYEERIGNVGEPTALYTARWILSEACNKIPLNQHLWVRWAECEEASGNIGSYDQPRTSAWIYKSTCEKFTNVGECWVKWSRFADKYNCIDKQGVYTSEKILHTACVEHDAGTDAWSEWVNKAVAGSNCGDYQTDASAAWILKEACEKHNPSGDPVLWGKWASFAKEHPLTPVEGNVSEEITAAAVLKKACMQYGISDSQTWAKWAKEETECGNIGDYSTIGTAAWIYKEACSKFFDDDLTIWLWWGDFIQTFPIILSDDTYIQMHTFFEQVCLEKDALSERWITWALFEEACGNIGSYSLKGSAAWIFEEGCINRVPNNHANIILKWVQFAYRHRLLDSLNKHVSAAEILDNAMEHNPSFCNPMWDELNAIKEMIGYK